MYRPLALLLASFACSCACARDLTLVEAQSLLVQHNRDLQVARRVVESADAQRVIAGARPNATFSINSTGIASNVKPDTVFRIDQPFERGNKRDLRLDAASGLQRAAHQDYLDVLRQQLATLQSAYFDLKLAQERALTLAENAKLFSGTLAAAERRLKAGDLAPADVAKVQVDYERAQGDARTAQAELARAQLALGYLIAMEAEALELRAVDPWPALERAAGAAIDPAIDARPDVAAARARVEAAEKLRDLARAQRTRDVTLGAQYERFPGNVPGNSVGVGFAVPLFTGNDFSGDIQKAEVDRYAALDARRTQLEATLARAELLAAIAEAQLELRALSGAL